MNKKSKIIIIGFGSIGKRHYNNLRRLGFKNVYAYDVNKKAITGEEIRTVKTIDYKTLARFDAAFICNPSNFHIRTALRCAKAGCHLFIEKPLSHNLAGVDKLQKLCRKNKLTVMVACNYLFHNGVRKMQSILRVGLYGKPILSRTVCISPVHCKYILVMDFGSHIVNYLRSFLGNIKKGFIYKSKTSIFGIMGIEAATIIFEHANGISSAVSIDYVSKKRAHRVEVITNEGTLTIDFKDDSVIFENENQSKVLYKGRDDINKMYIDEVKHFIECINKRKNPLQDLKEGKRVVEILSKAVKL